ncbi:maleylpyruvate isomerase N-terminal domain-containing protein [Nonomuraea sp. NPDC050790]|uniref:maleylpyruvate isomerase N-terminal domain-containing protein n=1 Tax=Nonomuraea sp. NPDC050790 TaxID=3364371 RepID=UPI0037B4B0FF
MVRDDFLAAARSAAGLLRAPEVAAAWPGPSALAGFSVSGLAGHLAYQVLGVRQALAAPVPEEETVTLLGHYERVEWIGSAHEDPVNVRIRDGGEQVAADGPQALVAALDAAVAELAGTLATLPERAVRIPLWGPWSLSLSDFLVTRMMELAVHSDDLAVSVGVPTPVLPDEVMETVLDLLARLAVRRHGQVGVLRALSRAERAPGSIAAF